VGGGGIFEGGGGGGASWYTKPTAYPYSNFPKCPLHSLLAQKAVVQTILLHGGS